MNEDIFYVNDINEIQKPEQGYCAVFKYDIFEDMIAVRYMRTLPKQIDLGVIIYE